MPEERVFSCATLVQVCRQLMITRMTTTMTIWETRISTRIMPKIHHSEHGDSAGDGDSDDDRSSDDKMTMIMMMMMMMMVVVVTMVHTKSGEALNFLIGRPELDKSSMGSLSPKLFEHTPAGSDHASRLSHVSRHTCRRSLPDCKPPKSTSRRACCRLGSRARTEGRCVSG